MTKAEKEIVAKIVAGTWWPFDRVDARLLEAANRRIKKEKQDKDKPNQVEEEALL